MMPPTRSEHYAALENAKLDVIRLGALADDAIRVVAGTQDVEALQHTLEATCIELITRQQPVVGEERLNSYSVEIARTEAKLAGAERVGDQTQNIAWKRKTFSPSDRRNA